MSLFSRGTGKHRSTTSNAVAAVGLVASFGLVMAGAGALLLAPSASATSGGSESSSYSSSSSSSSEDGGNENCNSDRNLKSSSDNCGGGNENCNSDRNLKSSSDNCGGGNEGCKNYKSSDKSGDDCESPTPRPTCTPGPVSDATVIPACPTPTPKPTCKPADISVENHQLPACPTPTPTPTVTPTCVPVMTDAIDQELPPCPTETPTPTPTPTDTPSTTTVPGGPTPVEDFCPNLPGTQWKGFDCNTGQQSSAPATTEATAIAAPQGGTVIVPAKKPAKKPTKVSSVRPGTVDAGVATVPSAANVPSAVNAGGGSSAPTTPLMGWALLAAGLLGAAGATTAMLAGRKE